MHLLISDDVASLQPEGANEICDGLQGSELEISELSLKS